MAHRASVTNHVSFFFIYNSHMPRLSINDKEYISIINNAAKLICTTPEFDDLARDVGLRDHRDGATDPGERARLRAELDAIVAHLYGLSEEEFAHILSTFPLVAEETKQAAMREFTRWGSSVPSD